MSKDIRSIPKLNADLELKKLGTIIGLAIYIDMSGVPSADDEMKLQKYLVAHKMLTDFFNPPEEPTNQSNKEK